MDCSVRPMCTRKVGTKPTAYKLYCINVEYASILEECFMNVKKPRGDCRDYCFHCHLYCLLIFYNGIIGKLVPCDPAVLFHKANDVFCVVISLRDLIKCILKRFWFFVSLLLSYLAFAGKRIICKYRTGCMYRMNDHLWNDKRVFRNVCAKTKEECEEKLTVMIEKMKREIVAQKEKKKQRSQ